MNTPGTLPAAPSTDAGGSPSPQFMLRIPRDFARRHLVMTAGTDDRGGERVLVAPSTPPWILDNLSLRLQSRICAVLSDGQSIARLIDSSYPGSSDTAQSEAHADISEATDAEHEAARLLKSREQDLLAVDGKSPVVRLVDLIFFEALNRAASDVHVQPLSDRTLVRYRVDGVLHGVRELPAVLAGAVISRIKVMAGMDVAEHNAAQDGRASVTIGSGSNSRWIDLRVSTLPTSHGERAVVRLLDNARDRELADFTGLGMPAPVQRSLVDRLQRAHGIVLVTGPTGSGKTTTLYAAMRLLAAPAPGTLSGECNIMTIEDPVEYELSTAGVAVSQTQTNPKKGLTFATGLRHILRQDPDVVMVGEIRDQETARMALQASLTGHLVLSTLHTNDAATAVTRLVELGVEPYLVSASLSAVLAQRLLRRLHTPCAGAGCPECLSSGYRGRLGVFELLTIGDSIRAMIARNETEQAIRAAARAAGMRTLSEEAVRLVAEGLTTTLEVERVVQGLDEDAE